MVNATAKLVSALRRRPNSTTEDEEQEDVKSLRDKVMSWMRSLTSQWDLDADVRILNKAIRLLECDFDPQRDAILGKLVWVRLQEKYFLKNEELDARRYQQLSDLANVCSLLLDHLVHKLQRCGEMRQLITWLNPACSEFQRLIEFPFRVGIFESEDVAQQGSELQEAVLPSLGSFLYGTLLLSIDLASTHIVLKEVEEAKRILHDLEERYVSKMETLPADLEPCFKSLRADLAFATGRPKEGMTILMKEVYGEELAEAGMPTWGRADACFNVGRHYLNDCSDVHNALKYLQRAAAMFGDLNEPQRCLMITKDMVKAHWMREGGFEPGELDADFKAMDDLLGRGKHLFAPACIRDCIIVLCNGAAYLNSHDEDLKSVPRLAAKARALCDLINAPDLVAMCDGLDVLIAVSDTSGARTKSSAPRRKCAR
mmetsp:Transcript_128591/g.274282  ORF Transcript_128591/g.274282 Transcript_128591/m.274282 type:complete len:428 (+) Transcript_128591:104-1387(+)